VIGKVPLDDRHEMRRDGHVTNAGVALRRAVPGAGHAAGLRTQPRAWEERVIDVLDEAMAGPG
jgi:hypothetical protein